ncbi:MAG: hypothetical protein KDH88_19765 [Chromatiales bacterium]|nr:hypothetical protein [Chromatiales bacterium]
MKQSDRTRPPPVGRETPPALRAPDLPVEPSLDVEAYRDDLAEFALTPAQEEELLGVLWTICRTFVDIGWGCDSVQQLFSGIVENALRGGEGGLEVKETFNPSAAPGGGDENENDRSDR